MISPITAGVWYPRLTNYMPGFETFGIQLGNTHDLLSVQLLAIEAAELVKDDSCPRFIEVGSWTGRTALLMAHAVPDAQVFCVDTFAGTPSDSSGDAAKKIGPDDVLTAFCQQTRRLLMSRIFPVRGPSQYWAQLWPWQAEMVFIDADHTYEACRDDIAYWRRLVRPGGILCGHDYGYFDGVTKAVDEIGGQRLSDGTTVWAIRL